MASRSVSLSSPIKNKPVLFENGTIVAGSSTESSDANPTWRVHFELSSDTGKTWHAVVPAPTRYELDAIQPTILSHADGRLQAIGRTRAQRMFETWSSDGGASWSPVMSLFLPNPNAGIDAVTLRDGRQLVVYNHSWQSRTPLNVAVSRDGERWDAALVLEDSAGEYSYPAVIQTSDGLVHVTYTWQRTRIKHVVIDPARLATQPMPGFRWPMPGSALSAKDTALLVAALAAGLRGELTRMGDHHGPTRFAQTAGSEGAAWTPGVAAALRTLDATLLTADSSATTLVTTLGAVVRRNDSVTANVSFSRCTATGGHVDYWMHGFRFIFVRDRDAWVQRVARTDVDADGKCQRR